MISVNLIPARYRDAKARRRRARAWFSVCGGYAIILAVVYAWTGEVDQSIATIEPLLSAPGGLILAELRLRWEWDPLRANPRFRKILEGPEPKTIY